MPINITKADQSELDKQKAYVAKLEKANFDFGFAVGSAFAESMRHIGYRNTSYAVADLVDNAIEAGATKVSIAFGYPNNSEKKPNAIAVIDDGHGMTEKMIRLSVLWGGSHRHEEESHSGFGRFGYGLPSACVSQGRRFSVYSKVSGPIWHRVVMDLDEIASGKPQYKSKSGGVCAPAPEKAPLPEWVSEAVSSAYKKKGLEHGTIVVIEKLDRLDWKTASKLETNLLQDLGTIFRNYLGGTKLLVDGTNCAPIDPLFTTPGARGFDEDEDRATALEPMSVPVSLGEGKGKVTINVRFSRKPLTFFSVDKEKRAGKGNTNSRWEVMRANHGLIVCRMGRQISVVTSLQLDPFHEHFSNDDRYQAVEVDFPASLDEDFHISTTKQQVELSDRIWEMLRQHGVGRALKQNNAEIAREGSARRSAKQDNIKEQEERPSESSMRETVKFKSSKAQGDPVERERKAREALEQAVKREAQKTGDAQEVVRQRLEAEAQRRPYKVELEDSPGGLFSRMVMEGGMRKLYINKHHPFYSEVYASKASNKWTRAALEVLLFSIGDAELDAMGNEEKSSFYIVERQTWSSRLDVAIRSLASYFGPALEEQTEEEPAAEAADA